MTLGLTKLHPALAGWMMVFSGPAATSAGASLLLGWRVDLVKDPAISEVLRLHGCPATKFGVINTDQIEFWEALQQRLVGDRFGLARPVVVLRLERLGFGRIEIFEVRLCEIGGAVRLGVLGHDGDRRFGQDRTLGIDDVEIVGA